MIIVIGTVFGVLIAMPINSQMQSALELTISSNYMIIISALASAVLIYCFTIIPIRRFDRIKPADAMRTQ
jgi:ABC-type antimicrobial peptide transport system permease subunit